MVRTLRKVGGVTSRGRQRARTFGRQRGCERAKAQRERRVAAQVDVEVVGHEHRIGVEQLDAVEPYFGDGGETVQAQAPFAGAAAAECEAIPVIVEGERRGIGDIEETRGAARAGDGAGHLRGEPAVRGPIGGRFACAGRRAHALPTRVEALGPERAGRLRRTGGGSGGGVGISIGIGISGRGAVGFVESGGGQAALIIGIRRHGRSAVHPRRVPQQSDKTRGNCSRSRWARYSVSAASGGKVFS